MREFILCPLITFLFLATSYGQSYCPSSGDITYDGMVTLVNFAGINNSSQKNQPYTDYTSINANVNAGSTYPITINLNTDGSYTYYAMVWIDWNQNGDFNDSGESFNLGSAYSVSNGATTNSPFSINVPSTAYNGPTRMRVSMKYNSSPGSCDTNNDGEVEDYSVTVSGGVTPSPTLNYTLSVTGGSLTSEKWVNITTGVNGSGSVVWAQGNGTIGNGAGTFTNQLIDLYNFQGQTLYLNAYDKYDDGWEGTVYSLNDQDGNIAANNAGNSPDDNANTDASSGWDGTSAEIEVSEAFTVNSLGPNINLNGTTQVGDLFACSGSGASSPKNFTLTGSSLTSNVTVSSGSEFEVSIDGSNFSSSLSISPSSGSVSETIYVRLKSGLNIGNYTANIVINSTGATTQNVALDGGVVPTTIYVSPSGNDNSGNGSQSSPFATLTAALTVSQSLYCGPATINILAGTYNDVDLVITNNDITIQGDAFGNTKLDGLVNDKRLAKISGNNITINDVDISNYGLNNGTCSTSGDCGGGALEIGDGITTINVTLNRCRFKNNINNGSSGDGGAIHVQSNANVTLNQCVFSSNQAGDPNYTSSNTTNNGGAIYVEGDATLNNCVLYRNISRGYGSAIYVDGLNAEADLYHCTVSENNARGNYGALTVNSGFLNVYNSIAYDNRFSTNSQGNDLYERSGLLNVSYSCYRDDYFNRSSISNSITSDPLFDNPATNTFSLQSGSPAIDAGLASYGLSNDINGLSRPQGSGYEMGAYEFSTCAPPVVSTTVVENCSNGTFSVNFTVSSYGDGTSVNITDGGSNATNNASLNINYTYGPYAVGTNVTLYYSASQSGGCNGTSSPLSGCIPNTCVDAIDLANGSITADFSLADNDQQESDSGGEPNYLQVGNGTTISNCNGGGVHSAYDYTEYKDLWYKVIVPAGEDKFTLSFSGVTGYYVVVPYYGTCGSLTQMRLLYNTDQNITGVVDNDGNNWYGDDPYVTPSITTLDFKGDEILNAPGGVVYLRIFPYDGGQGGSSGCISSNFSTGTLGITSSIQAPQTINSVGNGLWNATSTWDCGCSPVTSDNVIINHNIDLNLDHSIDANGSMVISNGALLYTSSGKKLMVDGNLINNGQIDVPTELTGTSRSLQLGLISDVVMTSPNSITLTGTTIKKRLKLDAGTIISPAGDEINMASDANYTALIFHGAGQVTGDVTINKFISNPVSGHRFFSSPVAGTTVNQFNDDVTLAFTGIPSIYYYIETDPSPIYTVGWTAPTGLNHQMDDAEGYTVWFNNPNYRTVDFTGVVNTGAISRPLTYTPGTPLDNSNTSPQGWNFVGNPYPSPVDWDLIYAQQSSSVENAYYVWQASGSGGSYISYANGVSVPGVIDETIGIMQGFWVRVNANSTLNLDNSMRVDDPDRSRAHYKTGFVDPLLRIVLSNNNHQTETAIRLNDNATQDFDSGFDAWYLPGSGNDALKIASSIADGPLSINTIPTHFNQSSVIPMKYQVTQNGTHTIGITEQLNFGANTQIFLEDTKLNVTHPLHQSDYTFLGDVNDSQDRFILRLQATSVHVESIKTNSEVNITFLDNTLFILFDEDNPKDNSLMISNTLGQIIDQYILEAGQKQYIIDIEHLPKDQVYFTTLMNQNKTLKILR